MPTKSPTIKKSSLDEGEQYELNQWLEENRVNSSNLRRSFTDVLPLARLLSRYYPEMIDLNYYPPRNSVQNKLGNWESFNKRVLSKLGLRLTREQMLRVAQSVPGSVEQILYNVMLAHRAVEKTRKQRSITDEGDDADDENEEEEEEEEEKGSKRAMSPQLLGVVAARSPAAPATPALQLSKHTMDTAWSQLTSRSSSRSGTRLVQSIALGEASSLAAAATATTAAATVSGAATGAGQRAEAGSNAAGPSTAPAVARHKVLFSIYVQAVNQLLGRDDPLARADQWTAHLEHMLQHQCDRIAELQAKVAEAEDAADAARGHLKQLEQRQGGTRTCRTWTKGQGQDRTSTRPAKQSLKGAAGKAATIAVPDERIASVRPRFD